MPLARRARPLLAALPLLLLTRAHTATYATGLRITAAAAADLTGSGLPDLILAGGRQVVVMRNRGGDFAPAATLGLPSEATGIAIADINLDGRADIALTLADGRAAILLNRGGGEFAGARFFPAGGDPSAIAAADFNGDGIPDLAVANRESNTVTVLLGTGDGAFQPAVAFPTGDSPRALAIADFNHDGHLDLATANFASNDVSILPGDGAGSFRAPQAFSAGNGPAKLLVAADSDNASAPDLAVANEIDGTVRLLHNDGSGSFPSVTTIATGSAMAVADWNADGHADLLIQSGTELRIHSGEGNGGFTDGPAVPLSAPAILLVAADFQGNGRLDLATVDATGILTVMAGAEAARSMHAHSNANPTVTTTTLVISPNPNYGHTVALTATVYAYAFPAPAMQATGSVTFRDGATILGAVALRAGSATLTTAAALSAGTHSFSATYSGDSNYATSRFSASQGILPPPTASVTSSLNASLYGQPVTFTATVSAAGGSGVVEFKDGTASLGTVVFNPAGTVSLSVPSLPAGTHAVTAIYSGDSSHGAATSPVLTQIVRPAFSSTQLALSGAAAAYGQPFTLFAAVSPASSSGSVTFYDGVSILGVKPVAGGQVFLTTSLLSPGRHSLRAFYSGSANVLPGSSAAVTATVSAVPENALSSAIAYAGGSPFTAVAVADFNGDGKADLAATSALGSVAILSGDGIGGFSAPATYATGQGAASVAVCDFNGDGYPDLAIANAAANTISILLGLGDGTFQPAVNYPAPLRPVSIAAGDFNGDGKPDLAVASETGGAAGIFLGLGDGTFQPAVSYAAAGANSVAVGDFNGDGIADLALSSVSGSVSILIGNGDGTFPAGVSFTVDAVPNSVTIADFNGDGKADIATANTSDVRIFLGKGDGTFQPGSAYPAGSSPQSIAAGDFNGDGALDLFVASSTGNSVAVLLGNGNGTFQTAVFYPAGPGSTSLGSNAIAVADLNGDGRADAVVANQTAGNLGILLGTTLTGLRFIPIAPCRIADTRNANGPFGGPVLAGLSSRDFVIPSSACQIPAAAQAYSLSIAVVPQAPLGFLTMWPAGQPRPLASTLNSGDGRIKSNAAIVPAGAGGAISIFPTNATHVVLDINGYFVPAATPGALAFYPVAPCRIADTRNATGPFGGPFLAGQSSRTVPMRSSSCGVPATAQAYSLNLAAVPHGGLGFLTVWPTGQPRPLVSSLNAPTGTTTSNAAIVPAGTNGSIDFFATNNTDLVVDLDGYFAPPGTGGLSFYAPSPCRVLDSRNPRGSPPFAGVRNIDVAGAGCLAPASAPAYVLNAIVVPQVGLGYLTLWAGGASQPLVSSLNAGDGAVTGNMAIVPASNGLISAFATNPTHLVLDLFGYFAP